MCGIVGIFAKDDTGNLNFSNLNSAVDALYHRGPDSKGIYTDENIGLGHTRLSIIILTDGMTIFVRNVTSEELFYRKIQLWPS